MRNPSYIRQTETESIMGDRIVLYYFTEEKSETEDGGINTSYAVGIDMYTQLPDQRTLKERKVSEAIFTKKHDAEKFIDMLCKYIVTPATLDDIIADNVTA